MKQTEINLTNYYNTLTQSSGPIMKKQAIHSAGHGVLKARENWPVSESDDYIMLRAMTEWENRVAESSTLCDYSTLVTL